MPKSKIPIPAGLPSDSRVTLKLTGRTVDGLPIEGEDEHFVPPAENEFVAPLPAVCERAPLSTETCPAD